MNINRALKIAATVQDRPHVGIDLDVMQSAFDRLSKPDQIMSVAASDARAILWATDKVNLD